MDTETEKELRKQIKIMSECLCKASDKLYEYEAMLQVNKNEAMIANLKEENKKLKEENTILFDIFYDKMTELKLATIKLSNENDDLKAEIITLKQ